MAAPADLEPPKGFGLGKGRVRVNRVKLRLGSGWSGPKPKVEIDHARPGQSFVPTSPAHNQSRIGDITLDGQVKAQKPFTSYCTRYVPGRI